MAYLKKYPDVLYESVQKNYSIDSILHLAVKDQKYKVIQAFFGELKEFPNAIKLILLKKARQHYIMRPAIKVLGLLMSY